MTNFPLLVRFETTPTNLYPQMASQTGGDLRFTDASMTNTLNHEIESWNPNGSSFVWVQTPALTATGCIYAYWGNPNDIDPPSSSTNGSVWSEGYLAVWHLHDTNDAGVFFDSTANGRDGVNNGSSNAAGPVADAQLFDGASSFIDSGQSFLNNLGQFTLCTWANGNLTAGPTVGLVGQNDALEFGGTTGPAIWTERGGPVGLNAGPVPNFSWQHISVSGDGTTRRIYVNGVERAAGGSATADYGDSGFPVRIGGGGIWNATGDFFDGSIDEVRVSSTARSSNWLWSVWMNMTSNEQFNVWQATEELETNRPIVTTLTPTNISSMGASLSARRGLGGPPPRRHFLTRDCSRVRIV
ncbi:MAG: DUF2341 domain-containing protein, partial [Verrucomicrobiota bacterium]